MYANIYYNGSLDRENIHGTAEEIRAIAAAAKEESPEAEIVVWQMSDEAADDGRGWMDDDNDHIETYTLF